MVWTLDGYYLLGTSFILRKEIGVGGPQNGNSTLLYVMKMSLSRGWVVLKSLKTPLRNIKMVPYVNFQTVRKIPQFFFGFLRKVKLNLVDFQK